MISIPKVRINEIIEIGTIRSNPFATPLRAVICEINTEKVFGYDVAVVYHQKSSLKCVKAEVFWDGEFWQFKDGSGMGFPLGESDCYNFKNILKK